MNVCRVLKAVKPIAVATRSMVLHGEEVKWVIGEVKKSPDFAKSFLEKDVSFLFQR